MDTQRDLLRICLMHRIDDAITSHKVCNERRTAWLYQERTSTHSQGSSAITGSCTTNAPTFCTSRMQSRTTARRRTPTSSGTASCRRAGTTSLTAKGGAYKRTGIARSDAPQVMGAGRRPRAIRTVEPTHRTQRAFDAMNGQRTALVVHCIGCSDVNSARKDVQRKETNDYV